MSTTLVLPPDPQPLDEIINVPWADNFSLGRGVDFLTGELHESALEDFEFRVPDRGSVNPTPLGGWDRGASGVNCLDGSL
jgi:hypothetical protein